MSDNKFYDLIEAFAKHSVKFRLVPGQMASYICQTPLKWSGVSFSLENVKSIPAGRGVYAFAVEFDRSGLPPHGYIMYIGKAGDGNHSLRKRFKDYFQDQKRPKRPVSTGC